MTRADLDLLLSPEAHQLIEKHLADRPEEVALRVRQPAIATQVKYLQRAKTKLPSWFAARAVVPPLAFEQSSSELAAFSKEISGETCLDLTCGLGVDAFSFSKNFKKVVATERDPVLADVARHNFRLMGAENIEVVTADAEDFVKNWADPPFDWVFIDPARRDGRGRKMFLPADCEPDVAALLPFLKKAARQILVKYSPMLDLDEAARLFPGVAEVGVLSISNECKEVWLRFGEAPVPSPKKVVKCWFGGRFWGFEKDGRDHGSTPQPPQRGGEPQKGSTLHAIPPHFGGAGGGFLIEPDVAFYKARMAAGLFAQYFPQAAVEPTAPDGYFLSQKRVDGLPSRQFRIIEQLDWQPKKLAALFKKQGLRRLNVAVRGFALSAAEARRQLSVGEGGELFLLLSGKKGWLCTMEAAA